MKILITGGAGFIGSHVVAHYQSIAQEIRVLDNLRTGYRHNLEGLKHTFIDGSITDREIVHEAVHGVDYIIHLAAMASVPESMEKLPECLDINVRGLLNVLEEASVAGVKKLAFASCAAIYGDNPTLPKVETMLPEPKSPYAITKLDGEYYLGLYQREGRLQTVALRLFNVFGPNQNSTSTYAAAVPVFIEKALRNEDITVFGDGGQTRDLIYVEDIADALSFALETPGITGVYNVGYGARITINDLAGCLIKVVGSNSKILLAPERPGDLRHSCACTEKIRAAGWVPRYSLEEGIAKTLDSLNSKQHAAGTISPKNSFAH